MRIANVRLLIAAALVVSCHGRPPAPPAEPFLLGRCPSSSAVPDTVSDVVQRARLTFAPPYFHPRLAAKRAATGNAVLRLTVDTLGAAEPGSIIVVASDNSELSRALCQDLLDQRYTPAEVSGNRRRTRGNIELHFFDANSAKTDASREQHP